MNIEDSNKVSLRGDNKKAAIVNLEEEKKEHEEVGFISQQEREN